MKTLHLAAILALMVISIGATDQPIDQKADSTGRFWNLADLESSRMKKRCEHVTGSWGFLYPEDRVIECDDMDREIERLIVLAKYKIVKGGYSQEDILEKSLPEYLASYSFEDKIRLILYSENEETIQKERDAIEKLIVQNVSQDPAVQNALKQKRLAIRGRTSSNAGGAE